MNRRTKSVADLTGNARVEYFFKMLQRHSGLCDAKDSLKAIPLSSGMAIYYQGRRISVPFLEDGIQMPLILSMDGGRDSSLANVIDATTKLWNKEPFCTYDTDLGGLPIPTYEWAKARPHYLDNPERRIADLRQTSYIRNLQVLGRSPTLPVTELRVSVGQRE
jgi:hypothetical protein